MIISLSRGRLGNQLFQYAALQSALRRNERLVLIGYDELSDFLECVDARQIKLADMRRSQLLRRFIGLILNLACSIRLLGRVESDQVTNSEEAIRRRGLLTIDVSLSSAMQAPTHLRAQATEMMIAHHHRLAAEQLLTAIPGRDAVAVHIRRGDYLLWPSRENPAVLPWRWIESAMKLASRDLTDPVFLFLSDDAQYVSDMIRDRPNCYLIDATSEASLAVLASARWQILSASTFSWWGAEFARRSGVLNEAIAPKYWAGWPQREWYPREFESSRLTFLEVE